MATSLPNPHLADPLLSLRRAIASSPSSAPILTTTDDLSAAEQSTTTDLSTATHLYITDPIPQTIPLSTPTRFISTSTSSTVDLRSIVFAWQKKDVAIPEYIDSAQELNEALKTGGEGAGGVQNLVFVERLDLITWLEGASEESEYIKPLEGVDAASAAAAASASTAAAANAAAPSAGATSAAQDSANVASGAAGGVAAVSSAGAGAAGVSGSGVGKTVDPRLLEIYNGERKMGDRNSVLRGIKPTDFSHVRKTAETFLGRNRGQYGANGARQPGNKLPHPQSTSVSIRKAPGSSGSSSHPNPIILLSPSASSLLRMTNVKSFLSDGVYVPPDHPTLAASTAPNILYISRPLQNLNSSNTTSKPISSTSTSTTSAVRPTRFIVVDSTSNFRPDYWPRLVAVFTTGQTWQFKSYKWSSPPELFKHATGIYVGWRGEDVPREVKGWGRGVRSFAVDRWDEKSAAGIAAGTGGAGRWRDREVVEGIWSAIEEGMRARGWGAK
ncbi:accessory factor associated with RNA polymerase II [Arachnomyces sp. PD_36]|nr:accessory factor associated with RNA polymerase II [Arachnomyces sp. PD_36]